MYDFALFCSVVGVGLFAFILQHGSTMDDYWGRQGAGAPTDQTKMSKLDNILNTPRQVMSTSNSS